MDRVKSETVLPLLESLPADATAERIVELLDSIDTRTDDGTGRLFCAPYSSYFPSCERCGLVQSRLAVICDGGGGYEDRDVYLCGECLRSLLDALEKQ
jgi:hypothetical protein